MSNGERIYLSLIGHRSELAAVETLANESVEIKPPRPLDAMVDAVDAPLGPEMIEPLLVHATVVLKFLAASVGFVGAVKTLLPKSERENPKIVIVDAKTNTEIVAVTKDTNPEEAAAKIVAAMKK
jgi:hypothetical protein